MSSSIITLQCLQSVIFEMPCVLSMWGAPLFSFMGLFFFSLCTSMTVSGVWILPTGNDKVTTQLCISLQIYSSKGKDICRGICR